MAVIEISAVAVRYDLHKGVPCPTADESKQVRELSVVGNMANPKSMQD